MLILYLALVLLGLGLSLAHARRQTGRTWLAVLGTGLAALAVLSGFSTGPYGGGAALLALVIASVQLRHRDRVA